MSEYASCFHGRDIENIRTQYSRRPAFQDDLASVPRGAGGKQEKASVLWDAGWPQLPDFKLAEAVQSPFGEVGVAVTPDREKEEEEYV